jgi:transcriptional regulator with XRE-family HTH domain
MPRSVHSDDYQRLLTLLIDTRRLAGVTQTSLAQTLRKPQSFVSKVETGERRLDVIEFCQWVSALKANPASLLSKFLKD